MHSPSMLTPTNLELDSECRSKAELRKTGIDADELGWQADAPARPGEHAVKLMTWQTGARARQAHKETMHGTDHGTAAAAAAAAEAVQGGEWLFGNNQ